MPMRKAETNLNILNSNTQVKKKLSIVQITLVSVLIILIVLIALPGYLSSQWIWSDLPKVSQINKLKSLEIKGLDLPGWQTIEQKRLSLGSHKWLVQNLFGQDKSQVQMFYLPQGYYRNHPEIEWIDLDGFEHWQKDAVQTLEFVNTAGNPIRSRFFKARNNQTYAVAQWYAWTGGGDYEIFPWFWRDELAQIRGSRVPWIAVSLKIIMSPLAELESQKALAQKLAQSIQKVLDQEVFSNSVR